MNAPIRSGDGWRMTLYANGDLLVSIWADGPDAAEGEAHKANMNRIQAVDRREHALAREFTAQQWAEHEQIRARA